MSEEKEIKNVTKVEVAFDEAAMERIEEMKKKAGVETSGHLFHNALVFYEWYLDKVVLGKADLLLAKDGRAEKQTFEL